MPCNEERELPVLHRTVEKLMAGKMVDAKIVMLELGELRDMLSRAANVLDPHRTPQWLKEIIDPFCEIENFPDSSTVVMLIEDKGK